MKIQALLTSYYKTSNSKGIIDGIGLHSISSPNLGEIETAINHYAELGLEIQMTELSINALSVDEEGFEKQAERYASTFRL